MKKYLISTLGLLVATFMFASQGFSTTTIRAEVQLNVDQPAFSGIPTGSCIMFILASPKTQLENPSSFPVTTAPDYNSPFFLSNGDSLLPVASNYNAQYPVISPLFAYADFGASELLYSISIDTSSLLEQTTYYFYVRIFNNISGTPFNVNDPNSPYNGYGLADSAFDASGHFSGQTLDSTSNIFYMNSELIAFTTPKITADPASSNPTFNPTSFSPLALMPTEPTSVPEPSVMFLMAGGLCWMFSRLRRK